MRDHRRDKKTRSESELIPIAGRRPIEELLNKGIKPEKLFVALRQQRGRPDDLSQRCREAGWRIEECRPEQLDSIGLTLHHQGFIAFIRHFPYWRLENLMERAADHPCPLIVALDEIQDVGNLGAILRSAECAGAIGAIWTYHRSAQVTAAVVRSSAGAALHLPLCRVVNLSGALDALREAGYGVFGADQEAEKSLYETDLTGPLALVVGSEGRGLRPGIKRRCDGLLSIPLLGRLKSLNVSVAAALCLYEAVRQQRQVVNRLKINNIGDHGTSGPEKV